MFPRALNRAASPSAGALPQLGSKAPLFPPGDILGDPVRRRILELLALGEHTSGAVVEVIGREFAISQPAVSQQLRVLRESGFASVRSEGTRRLYSVRAAPLQEVDAWLEQFRGFWQRRLDALATEVARGKRKKR